MRKFNELEAERQADVARLLVSALSIIDRDIVEGSLEAGEFDQAVEESAELADASTLLFQTLFSKSLMRL